VRVSRQVLLLLAAGSLLVGCSTTTAGTAKPTATDVQESTSESDGGGTGGLPTDGAPMVEDPLGTGKFEDDPCLALTSAQSNELGIGAEGKPTSAPLGNACQWLNESTQGKVTISFLNEDPRGLSAEYRANDDGKWAYFTELPPIQGYPAIARGLSDNRDEGACALVIGTSDEIAFELALRLSQANTGEKDPCDVAVDVADMAMQTMKRG
jgi:hypothetical protein